MVRDIVFNQYISLYVIIPLFLDIGLLLVFFSIIGVMMINICKTFPIFYVIFQGCQTDFKGDNEVGRDGKTIQIPG